MRLCSCAVSVVMWSSLIRCHFGVVPYVDTVVAVTVMRVLFFCVACVYAEGV